MGQQVRIEDGDDFARVTSLSQTQQQPRNISRDTQQPCPGLTAKRNHNRLKPREIFNAAELCSIWRDCIGWEYVAHDGGVRRAAVLQQDVDILTDGAGPAPNVEFARQAQRRARCDDRAGIALVASMCIRR